MSAFLRFLTDAFDRVAGGSDRVLSTDRAFVTAIALYAVALFLIKGFLYAGALGHDFDQLVLSQSFRLGYDSRNPPLYTWLIMASGALFGPGAPAIAAVRSVLIFLLYFLSYRAALIVLEDRPMAVLATLALFGIYQIGWRLPTRYSHTVLLVAVCAATLWVFLRLDASGRTRWYAAAGAIVGLGLIAKYNYVLFLLALLGAGLFDRRFRQRLTDRRMGLLAAIAVALALPHAYWMVVHAPQVQAAAVSRFEITASGETLSGVGVAMLSALGEIVKFGLPLLVVLPFLAWRMVKQAEANPWPAERYYRLLGLHLLLLIALVLLFVALGGGPKVRIHYLFVFVAFPLWLFSAIQGLGLSTKALSRFKLTFIVLAVTPPAVMLGGFFLRPLAGSVPRYNIPFSALAERISKEGFSEGTIYAYDYPYPISGNFRPYFPGSRIVGSHIGTYMPAERARRGQCLLVWIENPKSVSDQQMRKLAARRFGFRGDEKSRLATATLGIVSGYGKTIDVHLRLFPEGAGSCH